MLERTRRFLGRITGARPGHFDVDGVLTGDRRHADRAPSEATVICRAEAVGLKPTTVQIRDVSCTGVSFYLDRALTPGTMVTLDVPGADGSAAAVLACVRHATEDPGPGWVIGCSFSIELGEAALAGFGVPYRAPQPPDQRRWVRATPTTDRAVVQQLADHQAGPVLMGVVDLSPAGIGLLTESRLEPARCSTSNFSAAKTSRG